MLKIGVLSDSHVYDLSDIPKQAVNLFEGMDLIVHAGDFTGKGLLNNLSTFGNFKGVHGNMDSFSIKQELPEKLVLTLEGFKLGVIHPSEGGSPFGLEYKVKQKFTEVDAIIFGHTHTPKNELNDGVLYFNPGSITGKYPALNKTFGILEIDEEIKGKIVKL